MSKILTTTAEVTKELGGHRAVAEITGAKVSAAWNWKGFDTFPSNTYLAITAALEARGLSAPPSLWRMMEPKAQEPASSNEEQAA